MRARRRSLLALCGIVASLWAGGAGCKKPAATSDAGLPPQDADAGSDSTTGGWGAACETNADCESNFCLPTKTCSRGCSASSECPDSPSWRCDTTLAAPVCTCTPSGQGETCNGLDDDCDGVTDNGAPCSGGEQCVGGSCKCPPENTCGTECADFQTSRLHCGKCGNACGANEDCVSGACTCTGKMCGSSCVLVKTDSANCGDCGHACDPGMECAAGSCVPVDHEWADWPILEATSFTPEQSSMRDQNTKLLWRSLASDDDPGVLAQADALAYCDALVADGFDDWRLPTRIELLSLVNYAKSNPATDANAFPDAQAAPYWTATDSAADPAKAWAVLFADGTTATYPKTAQFLARCVR